jgi:DNA helicase-2/ATP-dependent DNA helicase PcrA
MREPTIEQTAVLDNAARVRVVRAVPGSGKTWLIAEAIRRRLDNWPAKTNGIAALTFTRVGGEEIRTAVRYDLVHPHFVGTIDSFLFRYVVRPHLRRVFVDTFAEPRLVVGEWGAQHWHNCGANQTTTAGKGINVFGCAFIGEEAGKPVIAYKPSKSRSLQRLSGTDLHQVIATKKTIWKKHGLLTHSDAAMWASKILEDEKSGAAIRAEIIRRFPFLVVDELQDTGHFLCKSIYLLLSEPSVCGLLVGDPDQAIYEFTGAQPELFEPFEGIAGAVALKLGSSQRCPFPIAQVASHLKHSGGVIDPAPNQVGRAILVRYTDMVGEVPRLVLALQAQRTTTLLKVIARGTSTVHSLIGHAAKRTPSLHCPALTHMHRAVVAFRQGRNIAALAAARASLDGLVFQHEGVSDEKLSAANIEPCNWKALAIRCMLKINALATTGTSYDWHIQAAKTIQGEVNAFGVSETLDIDAKRLRPQKRTGWDQPSTDLLPQPDSIAQRLVGVPVQTIHGVKGETHDVTVFVCPPTIQAAHCPSTVWWNSSGKTSEEKRIAYVAMTRTRGELILCVSEDCYRRLASSRAAFVGGFECMTAVEFTQSLDQLAGGVGER